MGAHLRHQQRDLRSIVRTFSSVFPAGHDVAGRRNDLLLIGTNGSAIAPHLDQLASEWQRGTAPAALADVGISGEAAPFALLSMFAAGPGDLQAYAGGAPLQTDDRMALEFSAPRGIYGRMTNANGAAIRALAAHRPPPVQRAFDRATDASWTTRGQMELKAEAYESAYDAFRRAVALNSRNTDALAGLSLSASGARRQDEERASLVTMAKADASNAPVRIELSRVLASMGDFDGSTTYASEALRLAPDDPRAGEQLASVFADAGDAERLTPLATSLIERFPARPDSRYYHATALFLAGRTRDAAAEARRSSPTTRVMRAPSICSAPRVPPTARRSARGRRSNRRCTSTRTTHRPTSISARSCSSQAMPRRPSIVSPKH